MRTHPAGGCPPTSELLFVLLCHLRGSYIFLLPGANSFETDERRRRRCWWGPIASIAGCMRRLRRCKTHWLTKNLETDKWKFQITESFKGLRTTYKSTKRISRSPEASIWARIYKMSASGMQTFNVRAISATWHNFMCNFVEKPKDHRRRPMKFVGMKPIVYIAIARGIYATKVCIPAVILHRLREFSLLFKLAATDAIPLQYMPHLYFLFALTKILLVQKCTREPQKQKPRRPKLCCSKHYRQVPISSLPILLDFSKAHELPIM